MGVLSINNIGANPIAARDNTNALRGQTITIDALANDTVFNSPLTIISLGVLDSGGTATIINSGTEIQYTSESSFVGTEQFNYTIQDSEGLTDTGIITVNVNN